MCDSIVATATATRDGAVWFGKNSDREPGEAQVVEHLPARRTSSPTVRCTYIDVPCADKTNEVLLSRPFWMWGAEMGVNQHGVAIGNEAVFTRLPVERTGLTGMDLLRLALELTSTARESLELITGYSRRFGQGGLCGYRKKSFRYHNSFIIADPNEAWVLETAGPFWVAQRVNGIRTISNALSIGQEFDLIGDGTFEFARSQGWCRRADDFNFANCFGDRFYTEMSGGIQRRACTSLLLRSHEGSLDRDRFFNALRDHAGQDPAAGWRMRMPCAHASWWPTRQAGQTTGSMVCRLNTNGSASWVTGTSSPCLSVFKPVALGGQLLDAGPTPGAGFDNASLFWRHERLHRASLRHYRTARAAFEADRLEMEGRFNPISANSLERALQTCWDEHREVISEWLSRVESSIRPRTTSLFQRYWAEQTRMELESAGDVYDRNFGPAPKPSIND